MTPDPTDRQMLPDTTADPPTEAQGAYWYARPTENRDDEESRTGFANVVGATVGGFGSRRGGGGKGGGRVTRRGKGLGHFRRNAQDGEDGRQKVADITRLIFKSGGSLLLGVVGAFVLLTAVNSG